MKRLMVMIISMAGAFGIAYAGGGSFEDIPQDVLEAPDDVAYESGRTQEGLATISDLGGLAKEESIAGEAGSQLGFAAGSPEAQFFLVGAYYSEALALTRGGEYAEAAKRLEALEEACIGLGAPSSLYHYVRKLRYMIEQGEHERDALVAMLELYQPLFEDYASGESADKHTLFRAGSWLVDMRLALAAGDRSLLRAQAMIEQIHQNMVRMDAPPGVIKALKELAGLSEQETISERDARDAMRSVKRLQQLLSAA